MLNLRTTCGLAVTLCAAALSTGSLAATPRPSPVECCAVPRATTTTPTRVSVRPQALPGARAAAAAASGHLRSSTGWAAVAGTLALVALASGDSHHASASPNDGHGAGGTGGTIGISGGGG